MMQFTKQAGLWFFMYHMMQSGFVMNLFRLSLLPDCDVGLCMHGSVSRAAEKEILALHSVQMLIMQIDLSCYTFHCAKIYVTVGCSVSLQDLSRLSEGTVYTGVEGT